MRQILSVAAIIGICILIAVGPVLSQGQTGVILLDNNGTPISATNPLNIQGAGGGGTSSSFGAAFPASGTAAGFKDAGGNMAGANLDAGGRLIINCGSGCAGAAGDGTATGALGALNATVVIALSTYSGGNVNFTSGGNLNGTVVAEGSNDGGSTYPFSVWFLHPATGALSASLSSPTSGDYSFAWLGSISHVRVRVSVYTAGSTTANLRTTATNTMAIMVGSDGTNLRAIALTTGGLVKVDVSGTAANGTAIKVDGSAVTQPVSGTVAATQSTSPWVDNVSQFGGSNVVTGTGAGGAGIPRVTISNDSSLAANQSANVNQWGGAGTTLGQKAMAASVPVAIASDQSAVTVTGTVTTTPPSNASTNVAQFGGSNVVTGTGASGAGIPRVTVANDSTVILGTGAATIGALTANQSVNVAQVNGVTTQTGTGTAGTGTQRVAVASDSTITSVGSITNTVTVQGAKTNNNAAPGATNVGTLPGVATNAAPSYSEGNQVALSTDLTGALRVAGGGGLSVTDSASWTAASSAFTPAGGEYNPTAAPLASGQQGTLALTGARAAQVNAVDSIGRELGGSIPGKNTAPVIVALAPTLPAQRPALGGPNALPVSGLSASVKNANQPVVQSDPATVVNLSPNPSLQCPITANVSQTGNTQIITGTAGKRVFFCSMRWVTATAQSVSLVSGTGSTCGTGTTAIVGSTTAANGESYAANGGVAEYSDRILTPPPAGMATGDNVCLLQSSSGVVAGKITYGLY